MQKIDIPSSWQKLISDILQKKGVVIILGGTDTGKTFLSHYLITELVKNGKTVALVDGDIGQSTIGPPTTIGIAIFKNVTKDFEKIKPLFMRFVGSTSPIGHLLQILVGIKKMVDKAYRLEAEVVIVDTTGFVSGDIARELKIQKIDLLGPRHIIALTRGDELEHIVKIYSRNKNIKIHSLKPNQGARTKSQREREKNREEKFYRYFKMAKVKEFDIHRFHLHGILPRFTKEGLVNLLIAFCDRYQNVLALGIIEKFHSKKGKIAVRTPLSSMKQVNSIQFGTLAIKSSGEQVAFKRKR